MPDRTAPLPGYRYIVDVGGRDPSKLLGGFSDVTGLTTEVHVAEYRDGNEKNPHVRKIPGAHTVGKVVLKRGVVDSSDLWAWMTATRTTGVGAQRDVTITMRDEANNNVQLYKLTNVVPSKYTGPTLSGKGAGDVAMEELELTAEGLEVAPAT
ncbi:MAG: phage tail protein [Candidatus Tumulicola sp.]